MNAVRNCTLMGIPSPSCSAEADSLHQSGPSSSEFSCPVSLGHLIVISELLAAIGTLK